MFDKVEMLDLAAIAPMRKYLLARKFGCIITKSACAGFCLALPWRCQRRRKVRVAG
jgi:hypothetical protein